MFWQPGGFSTHLTVQRPMSTHIAHAHTKHTYRAHILLILTPTDSIRNQGSSHPSQKAKVLDDYAQFIYKETEVLIVSHFLSGLQKY